MKVTLYARVSTDDKDQDPERQLIKCRQYAELHGHEILGEYQEHITGSSMPEEREQFSSMLECSPEGIIIYSMDRLTRQHPNKVMQMLNKFKDQGIKIISVSEPIFNMESDFAEPMQYFLSWWNNYFLKKLSADVKSGLDRARAKGKTLGRPKVKFNQYRAYQLLIVENKTLTQVAEELGTSRATLHRFKKVAEKEPSLFKKQPDISITDVIGTESK